MEKWKDKIMNSLEGIERAQPPSDAFFKINQKINEQGFEKTPRQWLVIAATISLVILANTYFITTYYKSASTTADSYDSYPALTSNYNIYEK